MIYYLERLVSTHPDVFQSMLKTCSVTNKALKNQYLGSETSDWSVRAGFSTFLICPLMFSSFLVLAFLEEGKGGKFYQPPVAHSTIVDFCLLVFHCYTHSHLIYFALKAEHLR